MRDAAATLASKAVGVVGASAGAVSGVQRMPRLAAGAAALELSRQHRSEEGILIKTLSLVRRVRRLMT